MKKIAIIGCGIMGSGMAKNFIAQGFTVYIWNRTKENAAPLLAIGALWSDTPGQATEQADVIFEVTANDESSRSVWLGDAGILANANPEKFLIISATVSAAWTDELINLSQAKDLCLLDIPLTGGRVATETGQLLLLAGGDKKSIDELQEVFKAISRKVFYFGPAGSGMRYKLILNMLQAVHVTALGEALKLAKDQEMDLGAVGEALCERPGGATTALAWEGFKTGAEKLNFSVDWITKDLNYAKELASGIASPFLDEALKEYREAIEAGKGKLDWTTVIV